MSAEAVPAATKPVRVPRRVRLPRIGGFDLLSILVLAATAALILYPLGTIVWRTFFVDRSLGLSGIVDALSRPSVATVFADTAFVVGLSSTLALAVGSTFAWLNERTDARTGLAAEFLPLVPLLVPQLAGVMGWAILLSPQAGFLNAGLRWLAGLFGIEVVTGPLDIFSYPGLVGVMALYLVPYVYLTVAAGLRNLDPSLEEASRMSGAGPWTTLRRITVPAVWPAIVNAGIIVLIFGISLFSVPIVIGTTAGIDLLSVRIYRLLYNHPPRTDLAVVLAMVMMVLVQVALLVQAMVTRAGRFAVIGGKGAAASRVALGRWRPIARGAVFAYLLLTAVIPVLALAVVSLQPFWSPSIDWAQLTLANYRFVLVENPVTAGALVNSIGLGTVGATIGMLAGALLMLYGRSRPAMQTAIDATTALPATLPHTVVAVSVVLAFTSGWTNLHGTLAILLVANLILVLPQAVRAAQSALAQIGRDLVEAARMTRSSAARTFGRIILPLMLPGLLAGWVILFVHISGELTASALLSGTRNPVVGLVLLDMWENGSFPQLSAIALVMTLLDAVVVLGVMRLFRGGVLR